LEPTPKSQQIREDTLRDQQRG